MLLFYNFEFELLYAENKLISSAWSIYYNKIGTFEAHLPITSGVLEILTNNRYLVVRDKDKYAVIIGYEAGEELVVYARTLNWILTKRIAPTTESLTENPTVICKNLIETKMSDVSNFEVSPIFDVSNVTVERNSMITLFDAVSDCLSLADLGHSLEFDIKNKKWKFNFLKGKNSDLLISEANKNAYNAVIDMDILDFANCGYYGDDGEICTEETGIYRWETMLSGTSEAEARLSLEKCKINSTIELGTKNLKFSTDYELGDIVRVQIEKGTVRTTLTRQIAGVSFVTQNGYVKESPIFENVGGIE